MNSAFSNLPPTSYLVPVWQVVLIGLMAAGDKRIWDCPMPG